MSQRTLAQLSVADNLCNLAREFESGDPVQAAALKKEFRAQSKNDIVRSTVYLMEVIGARDSQFKKLQEENKDLRELLDLKAPGWDKEEETDVKGTTPESTASNGMATAGANQDFGTGGISVDGAANGAT